MRGVRLVIAIAPLSYFARQILPAVLHMARQAGFTVYFEDEVEAALAAIDEPRLLVLDAAPPHVLKRIPANTPALIIAPSGPDLLELALAANPLSWTEAVRFVSRMASDIGDAASRVSTVVLDERSILTDPEQTATLIARVFHLRPTPDTLRAPVDVLRSLSTRLATRHAFRTHQPDRLGLAWKRADLRELQARVAAFQAFPKPGDWRARAFWTADFFFKGDEPGTACVTPVRVAGRSRILVYGPYFSLPRGNWSLSITFEADRAAADWAYMIEAVDGDRTARAGFRLSGPGLYTQSVSVTLSEAAVLEARLCLLGAAIDGALRFHGATVTRVGAASPAASSGPMGATASTGQFSFLVRSFRSRM